MKKAFSQKEKTALLQIIQDHVEVILNKNRSPSVLEIKENAWIEIGHKFNQKVDDNLQVLFFILLL